MPLARRPLLILLAFCALLLSACGSDDDGGGGDSSAAASPASAAFPVSIKNKFGSTTIKSEPKRVVVAGLREQDALLALGIVPVATTEWFGKHPGAIFPWAKSALGGGKLPTVLSNSDGYEIEKIAAQRPDVIIAIYSGLTKKDYNQLSKIAPVVAQPAGQVDYGSTWQQETLLTGQAVGRPAQAKALVQKTEKLIADTAAAHPEFKGQSAAMVTDYQGIFVYGPQDVRSRLLTELGFVYPRELRDAFPNEFGGQLSDERVDALDVGALIWLADGDSTPAQLRKTAVYKDLDVRKQGRDIYILTKDRIYEASSFPSVLSMPTIMKELVPRLTAAVDGDPATSTDQQPSA